MRAALLACAARQRLRRSRRGRTPRPGSAAIGAQRARRPPGSAKQLAHRRRAPARQEGLRKAGLRHQHRHLAASTTSRPPPPAPDSRARRVDGRLPAGRRKAACRSAGSGPPSAATAPGTVTRVPAALRRRAGRVAVLAAEVARASRPPAPGPRRSGRAAAGRPTGCRRRRSPGRCCTGSTIVIAAAAAMAASTALPPGRQHAQPGLRGQRVRGGDDVAREHRPARRGVGGVPVEGVAHARAFSRG